MTNILSQPSKMSVSALSVFAPLVLFLLYHARHSLPFAWHARVLLPMIMAKRRAASSSGASKRSQGTPSLRHEYLSIGRDPFTDVVSKSFQATIDDCDFMGHLSNSSYPKNLDIQRTFYARTRFLQLNVDGGWIALGGLAFSFKKEIPIMAKYEIRSRILTWDDKWVVLKNEFVSRGKKGETVVHCVCISKHCCKFGRKTLPPWFALAYSGFMPGSSANRSENFNKSQEIRLRLQKANKKDHPIKAFIPGQVKANLPEDQQWMCEDYWNTTGWAQACEEGKKELANFIMQ